MELSQLHFAYPLWLWAALAIPLVWIVYFLFYRIQHPYHQLDKFIDSHLLPYLLVNHSNKKNSLLKLLLLWTAVWSFLTLSLAGPRWNFREIETFSKDQSLVIMLDLSESMNATDLKPSRLVRAKQKIEDILNLSKGVKIGLIAFAADPHMITPLTDDFEMIRHLLPTLDTDLIHVQGSKLSPAFDMATHMLAAEPGSNKAILVISDGGFEDASAIVTAKKVAENGIVIYTMGVGTLEGTPIKDRKGNIIKKNGKPVLTMLDKERFSEISKIGNGRYLEANYSTHEEDIILKELEKRAEAQLAQGRIDRIWEEHFYLFIIPALPLILCWFRRGYVFALILILCPSTFNLRAETIDYFKNSEQLGKQALDTGDYEVAIEKFQDPYRKGVALYKAGKFEEAEQMFRQSSRTEVACHAAYNLGNSLAQQQKLKEAVTAYEDVLKTWPDHRQAKENLELVKKMLEQQKQESSNSDQSEQQKDQSQDKENSSQNESKNHDEKQDSQNNHESEKSQNQEQNEQHNNKDVDGQQKESQAKEEKQESEEVEHQDSEKEQEQLKEMEASQKEERSAKASKTQEDHDADLLLNRIVNDPKMFMKNKFYIESKKSGTTEGIDPW